MPTHCDSVRCSLTGTPGATAKNRASMPSIPAHGAVPRTHLALRATLGIGLRLSLRFRQVVVVVVVVVDMAVMEPTLFAFRTTLTQGPILGDLALFHLCTTLGGSLRLGLGLRQVVPVVVVVVVVVVVNVVVDVADVVDVVDVVIVVDVVVVVDVVDATPPALFVLRTTVSKGAVLGLLAMLHLCTNL